LNFRPQKLIPQTVKDSFFKAYGRINCPPIKCFIRQFGILSVPFVPMAQAALDLDETQELQVDGAGHLGFTVYGLSVCE
jgi:hypothetical protein